MPCVGFICPKCENPVGLEQAVEHLGEKCQVMYGPVVQSLVNSIGDERRGAGAGLSASTICPTATCPRQLAIARYMPYYSDPRKIEEAEEGSAIHHAMHQRGQGDGRWRVEVPLPGPMDEGKPGVRRNEKGFLELELWPGVWLSCIVDRVRDDWSMIEDLKTKRTSKFVFLPASKSAPLSKQLVASTVIQLNVNRLIAERLGYGPVKKMFAWVYLRGCYEAERRHQPVEIAVLDESLVRGTCETFAREAQERLQRLDLIEGDRHLVENEVAQFPMWGRDQGLFSGKKCLQYCEVNKVCFGLAGEVIF